MKTQLLEFKKETLDGTLVIDLHIRCDTIRYAKIEGNSYSNSRIVGPFKLRPVKVFEHMYCIDLDVSPDDLELLNPAIVEMFNEEVRKVI